MNKRRVRLGLLGLLGVVALGTLAIRSRADRETLFVYNAVSGDASLVRALGSERAQVTALPGMKLGRWNVRIGVLDDQLLTLDTESQRIHAISLAALREQPPVSVLHTTPLHAAAVPYRAVIHGDRVWVDYFATNRIEAYQWQRAARALAYLGEQILPATRPLGLSDLWVRGDQLLVAASGISCLARLCPKETAPDPHVFAFALDHAPLGALLRDLHPSNTNAAGLYVHPATGAAFVINAGDYRDGYSSIQRIDANQLGPEGTLGAQCRRCTRLRAGCAHRIDPAVQRRTRRCVRRGGESRAGDLALRRERVRAVGCARGTARGALQERSARRVARPGHAGPFLHRGQQARAAPARGVSCAERTRVARRDLAEDSGLPQRSKLGSLARPELTATATPSLSHPRSHLLQVPVHAVRQLLEVVAGDRVSEVISSGTTLALTPESSASVPVGSSRLPPRTTISRSAARRNSGVPTRRARACPPSR